MANVFGVSQLGRAIALLMMIVPAVGCVADGADGADVVDDTEQRTGELARTTHWDCFRSSDGKFVDRVSIWWGHQPGDATWACNTWVGACSGGGGCRASGGSTSENSCNVRTQMDGCSLPSWLNDPQTNRFKEEFRDACNAHDACYRAPWSKIGGDGFKKCNDNFWNDMQDKCNNVPWYLWLPCKTTASVWATTMNGAGNGDFQKAYRNGQQWLANYCRN